MEFLRQRGEGNINCGSGALNGAGYAVLPKCSERSSSRPSAGLRVTAGRDTGYG
jgi:hypothetical protein